MASRLPLRLWDREAATRHGTKRAALTAQGRNPAPLDMLIAAHAQSTGTMLVSNEQAFRQVDGLPLED